MIVRSYIMSTDSIEDMINKSRNNLASENNVVVIDGFMEMDHVKEIHALCVESLENPDPSNEWWYHKFPGPEYASYAKGKYAEECQNRIIDEDSYHRKKNPLLKYYMDKMSVVISYMVGRKVVPIFHFNRHQSIEGVTCPGHTDSEGAAPEGINYLPDYSPNHLYEPAIIEYSANIYINDDYDEGELYFPDYDLKITHTPGQLVFFPGTVEYTHAVHTVRNGTRWNLITHLARPKLIEMHSIIHNMWSVMTDEQKSLFPEEWNDGWQPRGVREGNLEKGLYDEFALLS